jgi:hypothetical protein
LYINAGNFKSVSSKIYMLSSLTGEEEKKKGDITFWATYTDAIEHGCWDQLIKVKAGEHNML